jgi:predicted deacetylase
MAKEVANHMSARFLIRIDDICPTINWQAWQQMEAILIEENVQPILGVIPDNQDPRLREGVPDARFWDRVRSWQARGWAIGLHGYRHEYVTKDAGILKLKGYSEFAGLPVEEQRGKLERAMEIFCREGVRPDVWVAPAHSFDGNTVQALLSLGIRTISDGLSLYPHRNSQGVFWVPQQLWTFRPVPFGVWTVCIHLQDQPYADLEKFRRIIRKYKHSITSLSQVVETYAQRKRNFADVAFASLWRFVTWIRRALLAQPTQTKTVTPVMETSADTASRLNAAQ